MKKSDFIVIGAVVVIVGILLVCLYVFGGDTFAAEGTAAGSLTAATLVLHPAFFTACPAY